MTKEQREKKNRLHRKWYLNNLEHARKYNREWHKSHYVPHPRKKRVLSDDDIADWFARRNAKRQTAAKREYNRNYYKAHKDYFSAKRRESRQRLRMLMARSHELYAFHREKDRMKHKRIRDLHRKRPYHECRSRRIPDNCVFCANPLDRNSPFLRNNMDANTIRSCDNYVMNLRIERKKQRKTYV